MAVKDEIAVVLQGQNPEGTRRHAWSVVAGRDLFGSAASIIASSRRRPPPSPSWKSSASRVAKIGETAECRREP